MIMTGMIGSEIAGLRKKDIQQDHIAIRKLNSQGNMKNRILKMIIETETCKLRVLCVIVLIQPSVDQKGIMCSR